MKEQNLGRGVKVLGFETMEEMVAYQLNAEHEANQHCLDEQKAIPWGGYVLRVEDDLSIFGRLYTKEEYMEDGSVDSSNADTFFNRNFRYGQFFSVVVPTGEYGSAHVVELWPITKSDFDEAQERAWTMWPELLDRVYTETKEALERREKGE